MLTVNPNRRGGEDRPGRRGTQNRQSRRNRRKARAAALALCACALCVPAAHAQAATLIAQEHTVASGECMSTIAARYGMSYETLLAANPQFPAPERLFPGQIVHIPETGPVRDAEEAAAALINTLRLRAGLSPLEESPALCRAARNKSRDMRDRGYYGPLSPAGAGAADFLAAQGLSGDELPAVSERLAWGLGSAWELVRACMDSPEHRESILDPSLGQIGIGWVPGWNLWTLLFTA